MYDPCMGSGSLLLNAKKYAAEPDYIKYYGQELNTSTFNLARMNMFLHGIVPENQVLRNGDTLDGDWPTGEETDFNIVLMNPPYSAKWSAAAGFLQDERFSDYGVLAPKSKADYAFLLHGLYHLKNNGTMAIVLPHGVLFRGAAEGKIREKLLRSGNIYAVIGLPANLFYNTSIPTCIVVLKNIGMDGMFYLLMHEFKALSDLKRKQMGLRSIVPEQIQIPEITGNSEDAVLQICNLSCKRKKQMIFQNISLSARAGDIISITGKNGAGRQRVMNCMADVCDCVCCSIGAVFCNEWLIDFKA